MATRSRARALVNWIAVLVVATSCTTSTPSVPAAPAAVPVPIAALAIDGASTAVTIGKSRQLTAVVTLPDGAKKAAEVAWKSSDETVATISSTGLLSAKNSGAVEVTASGYEHSASAPMRVRFRVVGAVHE